MLVQDDRIETQLVRQHELLEIALIEFMPFFRVVVLVRKTHPGGFEFLVVFRQMRVRHEVHDVESKSSAHFVPPL